MPRLEPGEVAADPFEQFSRWLDEAREAGLREPTACALATAGADGAPSARMVLLKAHDARGMVFTTNYESRKAAEIEESGRAALLFYWGELDRQVRIEGGTERIAAEESDSIFARRPRGARLGSWASPQSRVVRDRDELEQAYRELEERFGDDVPRPPHWGGFRLVPERIEFWQGHVARLHDRLSYRREQDGRWRLERLGP